MNGALKHSQHGETALITRSVMATMGFREGRRSKLIQRRGFTLIEVIAAASIIGVIFLVTIPLLGHVLTVRQEAGRRTVAQHEAANVMERVALLARQGSLADAQLDGFALSRAAVTLPDSSLDVAIAPEDGPLRGTRTTVSVSWKTDAGTPAAPVVLTAWFPGTGEGEKD